MTSIRRSLFAGALAAVLVAPAALVAQGTLSTQGLGFPPGQLGTASLSMGGSTGQTDPYSALNPASIGMLPGPVLLMQVEPEYRILSIADETQRTSLTRFPLFMGALPVGPRWVVALSASTLLDRTWATITRDSQFVGPDTLASNVLQRSDGSIADLRLAVSFAPTSWLRLGVGGHGYTGRDLLQNVRVFDDSARYTPDTLESALSFGGSALSVGAQVMVRRVLLLGASYRRGLGMKTYDEGEELSAASAPDHFGVSVVYIGISGMQVAARAGRDTWSRLRGLGQTLHIHEGPDLAVGAEVMGPRLGGTSMPLRIGSRWRTLPFSASGTEVRERTLSGGFGLPMGFNRVLLNVGALHAVRSGHAGISERAWTISTGFVIRP